MSEATRQWLREAEVVIGKAGAGVRVRDLRVRFEVVKSAESAPNTALIKLYNLHPDNVAKIKHEFDEIVLNAGYRDAMRLIFRGTIKHVAHYREQMDFITEISAGDGDNDFYGAVMNETLAAGTSTTQIIERAVASFKSTGKGYVEVTNQLRIRGKVLSGSTRDVLRDLARDNNANWSIQDGMLTIVPSNSVLPNEALLINAETGMLGAPAVNDKGVSVKCLMNPLLRINGAIKLDNASIQVKSTTAKADQGKGGAQGSTQNNAQSEEKSTPKTARLDPDGLYKVIKLTHKGDTRDSEWVSEIDCVSLETALTKPKKKAAEKNAPSSPTTPSTPSAPSAPTTQYA